MLEKDLLGPQKPWSCTVDTEWRGGSLVVDGSSQLGDWLSGKVTLFPSIHYTQKVTAPDLLMASCDYTAGAALENVVWYQIRADLTHSTTICFKTDHLGMNTTLLSLVS